MKAWIVTLPIELLINFRILQTHHCALQIDKKETIVFLGNPINAYFVSKIYGFPEKIKFCTKSVEYFQSCA